MSSDFKYPLTNCKECPLSGKFGRGYEGNIETADVMILGEAPGATEERTGLPFQGKAGQLLRRFLKKHNFPFDKAIITNPVLCRPPDNKTPTRDMIKACKCNMYALMNAVQPKFVVLTGNVPMQVILGKKGITKARGSMVDLNGAKVFPIFHPSYVSRKAGDKDIEKGFDKDVEHLCNRINGTHEEQVSELDYNIVDSIELFDILMKYIYFKGMVSIDIEATGLRHWQNKIRSIQFCPEEKHAYYVPILEHKENCLSLDGVEIEDIDKDGKPRKTTLFPYWKPEDEQYIWGKIKDLLIDDKILKTGQNFKFDAKFFAHYLFKEDYAWTVKSFIYDTIFGFYLLNENSPNDLKSNAYVNFPDLRGYAQDVQSKMSDKAEEEEDWTKIRIESLAPYGCGDADATLRLANLYASILIPAEEHSKYVSSYFYNFYMPLSKIMTKAERVGVGLDIPKMEKVKAKYEIEKQEIEDEILTMAGRDTDAVVRKKILEIKADMTETRLLARIKKDKFNLNSSPQLAGLLFDEMKLPVHHLTDGGARSTDKETLKILAIDYPFCRKIVKFRNRVKMITTYFNGALKELELGGTIVKGFPMLHFTCNLIGTVTGRTCLVGDTLISTEYEEISIADLVNTIEPGWHKIKPIRILTLDGLKPVSEVYVLEPTETIKIELEDGTIIEGHKDHRLIIDDKKITLEELSVGDFVEKVVD